MTVRVFIVIACKLTIFGGVNIARLPSTDVQVGGLEGTARERWTRGYCTGTVDWRVLTGTVDWRVLHGNGGLEGTARERWTGGYYCTGNGCNC